MSEPTIDAFVESASKEQMANALYSVYVNYSNWPAYLAENPDLVAAGVNPLTHLLQNPNEGRMLYTLTPRKGQPAPPTPGGWQPPTTPGMHEICRRPGAFGMSACRVSDGLLIGTYRQDGQVKLLHFNGQLTEVLSLPAESIYMIHMPPDGLPVFTTECPAQIYKCLGPWDKWERVYHRDEPDSVAFEFQPLGIELVVQTVDRAWGNSIRLIKGDINGKVWQDWKNISGRYLNFGSDGTNIKLCGSSGATAIDYPLISNENGGDTHSRPEHKDQQYSYVIGKNGLWSIGAQSITESDGFRRAYIEIFDGTNLSSVYDFDPPYDPPWTMDMHIDPSTGHRWCLASVWAETGRCQPVLACSKNNGETWEVVTTVPMTACIAMHFADSGVYLIGGKYNEYMKCLFYKF